MLPQITGIGISFSMGCCSAGWTTWWIWCFGQHQGGWFGFTLGIGLLSTGFPEFVCRKFESLHSHFTQQDDALCRTKVDWHVKSHRPKRHWGSDGCLEHRKKSTNLEDMLYSNAYDIELVPGQSAISTDFHMVVVCKCFNNKFVQRLQTQCMEHTRQIHESFPFSWGRQLQSRAEPQLDVPMWLSERVGLMDRFDRIYDNIANRVSVSQVQHTSTLQLRQEVSVTSGRELEK